MVGIDPASPPQPLALHEQAASNLSYIRQAMERAGSFTAVPGWGQVAIGVSALAAAVVARRQPSLAGWLAVWLGEAVIAVAIGVTAMARKARRTGVSLLGASARKFALGLTPSLVAGAVLTVVLVRGGAAAALPGTWLLLYGAGVVSGGAFSVGIVPVTGGVLMLTGVAALASPQSWGDALLALGFGVVQIVSGVLIARRSGG
jgi:hypothetical protein